MVVFLDEYKNSSDSKKIYLESSFAYAIYDYLENNPQIKNKKLKEIAEEIFFIEKDGKARKFLEDLIKNKDKKFIQKINPYLLLYHN